MEEKKRYYWIKLKENFFDLETIDWLISQKNGCEYIVLYQKLCLMTANKGGKLAMQIGEMIIPYEADKIARDTKFDIDTVLVAMELFKKIGLIYEQEDGILKIPYIDEIVGSETSSAQRVREHRRKKKLLQCNNDVTQEIDIDNRDKIQDIENTDKDVEKENIYIRIISHLNEKAGTNYRASGTATKRHINARLAEGFTVDDFITVIDKKCAEWKGNSDMEKYLRPETLFGTKFENYLNAKSSAKAPDEVPDFLKKWSV